jgi:hypothetical protein
MLNCNNYSFFSFSFMRFAIVLLVMFAIGSCTVKQEQYPDEPIITFKEYSRTTIAALDTFSMVITFTDGDGDIGITDGIPPRNDTVCVTPYNVIITNPGFNFFYKDLRDSCTQFARTEYYEPEGNNKSIKGEVVIRLGAFCKKQCSVAGCNDTARFELLLRDRAGNLSNKVITPPLVITGCR